MYVNDQLIEEICWLAAVRLEYVMLCYDSHPVEYQAEGVLLFEKLLQAGIIRIPVFFEGMQAY